MLAVPVLHLSPAPAAPAPACLQLPWFNDFHPKRLADAARAFYATLYHYHLPGQRGQRGQQELVSGFKEVRLGVAAERRSITFSRNG